MAPELYDAHCHLSEHSPGGAQNVVNGTKPSNWGAIIERAQRNASILPGIGLHPWEVKQAPADWRDQFKHAVRSGARVVGEIGLDRWIENDDFDQQEAAFRWQLNQSVQGNLPVSIHCLKATDPLLRILKEDGGPERGIHLHAYNGSAEQVSQFADCGAYFSFNVGQLGESAKKAPAAVRSVPADRLLIETDAPDMLEGDETPSAFLEQAYERIAELRDMARTELVDQVAANFTRYFLDD